MMNRTHALLFALILATSPLLVAADGCGPGLCKEANDHVAECLRTAPPPGDGPVCEGRTLCEANCVKAACCEEIRAAHDGDVVTAKTFLACLEKCAP